MAAVTIKDILIEILTIAGYPGDKEQFIADFETCNLLDAMTNVYQHLPVETQEWIKEHADNPQQMQQYIPQDIFIEELFAITRKEVINLLHTVAPKLNYAQRERIHNIEIAL